MKVITGKRALHLASHYKPVISTEIKSVFDVPTEINFGHLEQKPETAAYFSVKTDEKYYYILYAFYHYWDYTKFALAKPFDEHRHDFEGVIYRIPYFLSHHEKTLPIDLITVFHKKLLYYEIEYADYSFELFCVYIQSQGHGIQYGIPPPNYFRILDYRLLDLNNFTKTQWETYKKVFNKNHVHMPDQWADEGNYAGWIWKFPDKLFDAKEKDK